MVKTKKVLVDINCDGCGLIFKHNTLKHTDYGFYCDKCFPINIDTCSMCNNVKDRITISLINGNLICDSCIEHNFTVCADCLEYVKNSHTFYSESTNKIYCKDCHDVLINKEYIHEHSYVPKLSFNKMPWENTVYLGVELEINVLISPKEHSEMFRKFLKSEKLSDWFFFKKDGSLYNGYEIVTHPFTLQSSHKNIDWRKILGWLRDSGASSYETGECGLHIHVSRKNLNILDVGKLKMFMWNSRTQIEKLSKRKKFNYCQHEKFDKTDLKNFISGNYFQDGRYWALNTTNSKGTIEFRIFRGTLNYARFMASLQFCQSACEFVQEHGTTSIASPNCWKIYLEFLHKKGTFQMLEKYLAKEKIV